MGLEETHPAVSAVMGMADLLAKEGDRQRAVELLALVLQHPASLQVTKDRAQDLLSELESELLPDAVAAGTARGQARALEEVAAEVLGKPPTA